MLEIERSAETLLVRSDCVTLAFHYRGDRWFHELAVREIDGWQTLLTSMEGGASDSIPPSAALQDLRLEQLNEQTLEFQGMGQAGAAIYSAAIRFNVADRAISFDLCVRGKRADSLIQAQSLYQLTQSGKGTQEGVCVLVTARAARLTITPLQIPGQPVPECRLSEQEGRSQVSTGFLTADTYVAGNKPRTVRWGYDFKLDGLP